MNTLTKENMEGDTQMLTIDPRHGDTEVIRPRTTVLEETVRPQKPIFPKVPGQNAYELRQALECARLALAAAADGDKEPRQKQFLLAERQRQQFWVDTCRHPLEARSTYRPAAELHRQHGWRFLTPSLSQVQSVLEALDSALPKWDQEHPSLFFQTLELNFPGVLRLLPRHWKQ
jgi:hypothetical protein